MQMDEALLFKTFDSETDGRSRFTIHSSFEDPNAPVDATTPREYRNPSSAFFLIGNIGVTKRGYRANCCTGT